MHAASESTTLAISPCQHLAAARYLASRSVYVLVLQSCLYGEQALPVSPAGAAR